MHTIDDLGHPLILQTAKKLAWKQVGLGFCRHQDQEDLSQDLLLYLCQQFSRYSGKQPLLTWACALLHRRINAINRRRLGIPPSARSRVTQLISQPSVPDSPAPTPAPAPLREQPAQNPHQPTPESFPSPKPVSAEVIGFAPSQTQAIQTQPVPQKPLRQTLPSTRFRANPSTLRPRSTTNQPRREQTRPVRVAQLCDRQQRAAGDHPPARQPFADQDHAEPGQARARAPCTAVDRLKSRFLARFPQPQPVPLSESTQTNADQQTNHQQTKGEPPWPI